MEITYIYIKWSLEISVVVKVQIFETKPGLEIYFFNSSIRKI